MGLIKAVGNSLSKVLADSWREFFSCDAMESDVLVTKANKVIGKGSSNTKGTDNVISNGSIIAVADGQCMIIVDNGKVAEICAEPGEFVYDSSTEPSLFYGGLGKGIVGSFASWGQRITFGGQAGKDQRVYYINTKEIMSNKYGTPAPVPFRVVDQRINLDIDISVRCHGEYSYQIVDPILFYTNVCGNVADEYRRDKIDAQLKSELLTALQPAFAKISALGVRYYELPGHTLEMADALNEVLSAKWAEKRGIKIKEFGISSVKASEEDEERIKQAQENAMYMNPAYAAGYLAKQQGQAMVDAANNSGGSMMGLMGMNMASALNGGTGTAQGIGNMYAMGMQQQQQQQQAVPTPAAPAAPMAEAPANGWTCACGTVNTANFCSECGAKKPVDGWTCACGAVNKGKFCPECGAKKPAGALLYKCDKCGWEPEDPTKPPKFCPECGDAFDENDTK